MTEQEILDYEDTKPLTKREIKQAINKIAIL